MKSVPLADVSIFIRQLSHDLHNDLNALGLGTSYIGEWVEDADVKKELISQRKTFHRISKVFTTLTMRLQPPKPELTQLSVIELLNEFRVGISELHPVEFSALLCSQEVGTSQLEVDYQMICNVLTELFENALRYREGEAPITFAATVKNEWLSLEFSEKSREPVEHRDQLGQEPFTRIGRRSYGLGLFYANRVAQSHGGRMETSSAGGCFFAKILIPIITSVRL